MLTHKTLFCSALIGAAIMTAAPVAALPANFTPEAKVIYDAMRAQTEINEVCRTEESMRAAMRRVVRGLQRRGQLTGDAERPARIAGEYIYFNCGGLR